MSSSPLSLSDLRRLLTFLLEAPGRVPADWDPAATTYDLPRFHGGEAFVARFTAAGRQILDGAEPVATLAACGLPYDYARLGHPWSSVYELYLEALTGAARAVSFASRTKAFLAPLEVPGRTGPARLISRGRIPLSEASRARWDRRQITFHDDWTGPLPEPEPGMSTLFIAKTPPEDTDLAAIQADAVACPVTDGGVLLLRREDRFDPDGLQLIRKRTVAALLAHTARAELMRLLGLPVPPAPTSTEAACEAALKQVLPEVQGAAFFCTGLAAEAAVFEAAAARVSRGEPVPLFYAENGYGGTGQLIQEVLDANRVLAATPLPVMDAGGQTLVDHVLARLDGMSGPAVVFVETPTNPQLQVHDFPRLARGLKGYRDRTGHTVPVLVDTTMAPLYPLFALDFARGWPFLVVKSGSKYFTRGKATLGVVMAGPDPLARDILEGTRAFGRDADSFAKPVQLHALHEGLSDLRPRMEQISANTLRLAEGLRQQLAARGHDLLLYAMTPEQLRADLHCGIVSFYLPPAPTTHADLVDEFVDELLQTAPGLVKNRVSYGQSRGGGQPDPFYVINPEESTQGALSAEVKEAQKRDGVQICRISVPQHADVEGLLAATGRFVERVYGGRG
jgi:cystathionine beta-lyase/cystathionine gamma-synthase